VFTSEFNRVGGENGVLADGTVLFGAQPERFAQFVEPSVHFVSDFLVFVFLLPAVEAHLDQQEQEEQQHQHEDRINKADQCVQNSLLDYANLQHIVSPGIELPVD